MSDACCLILYRLASEEMVVALSMGEVTCATSDAQTAPDVSLRRVSVALQYHNGLFHFISIHPLWMSVNWCPGGYIDKVLICVRGVRIDFNLCQGVANSLQ